VALDMDEKWDVFVEGRVAYAHRSWTGFGIFEATFAPVDGGWRIATAVAESNTFRHRPDRLAMVMLELVFSNILLGEPAVELRAELVALMKLRSADSEPTVGAAIIPGPGGSGRGTGRLPA
jgi:hypothetical protein